MSTLLLSLALACPPSTSGGLAVYAPPMACVEVDEPFQVWTEAERGPLRVTLRNTCHLPVELVAHDPLDPLGLTGELAGGDWLTLSFDRPDRDVDVVYELAVVEPTAATDLRVLVSGPRIYRCAEHGCDHTGRTGAGVWLCLGLLACRRRR